MRPAPLCSLALLASVAVAQTNAYVTVTDANMEYRQGPLPAATSNTWPSADLRSIGPTSTDNLWSLWWYFRVAGDPQEYSFREDAAPNTPTRTVTNPLILTTWPDVHGRGLFSATLTEVVVSTGADRGYVAASMTLANLTNSPLVIDLFSISDLEAGGSSSPYFNNNVAWGNERSQYAEVANSTLPGVEFYCPDADQVQVDVYGPSTPGRLPYILSNGTVDDLTGWNGVFGPADHNGAFQWHRTIPALGTAAFTVFVAMTGNRPMQAPYGTAGAGTPGLPTIDTSERPIVDPTGTVARGFDMELRNALAGTAALLVTNFAQSSTTYQGISIWVDPNAAATRLVLTDAAGAADVTIALPPLASLYGVPLNHQFFVIDSGGPSGFAAWTSGLSQQIGTW
ncbi:MAG: hypothetical protein KDE27_29195 [Planctomycetes bacterium]|nr:hypothetical protein [Planctomycetota bacterium]